MKHTLEPVRKPIAKLRQFRAEYDRADGHFEMVVLGRVSNRDNVKRWEDTGITRLIVTPWSKGGEALDGIRRFADEIFKPS
jgi:hypothetical protein